MTHKSKLFSINDLLCTVQQNTILKIFFFQFEFATHTAKGTIFSRNNLMSLKRALITQSFTSHMTIIRMLSSMDMLMIIQSTHSE